MTNEQNEAIILENIKDVHIKEVYSLINLNRDYLKKWLSWVENTNSEKDTQLFAKLSNKLIKNRKGIFCIVKNLENIIGIVGATSVSKDKMNLNYWISEDYSNKGIATTAVDKMISFLDENWNVNNFEIKVSNNNIGSVKVAEKLGFYISEKIYLTNELIYVKQSN